MLRVVRAVVLERNVKVSEARAEVMGVLDEIEKSSLLDHCLLETITRSVARMIHCDEYMARYLQIIESLVNEHPKDKELA